MLKGYKELIKEIFLKILYLISSLSVATENLLKTLSKSVFNFDLIRFFDFSLHQ